ncbi:unnamed protein product [Xylocopa violacea]|uniref:WAP domain-containing protein n=1 Tax=Xylocopa violacea TaxID=135666 RepID=A0ABP1NQ79_XYLVO
MDLHGIVAILFCAILVNFTGTDHAEARGVKKFHNWHGNNHGHHLHHLHRLHQLHHLENLEHHDLAKHNGAGRSKNTTSIVPEEDATGISMNDRTKREYSSRHSRRMNVHWLKDSSICNYTIEPIDARYRKYVPTNLHHIRCSRIDDTCDFENKYCCLQTYEHIDVRMGGKSMEQMELDTGCVYATKKAPNLRQ